MSAEDYSTCVVGKWYLIDLEHKPKPLFVAGPFSTYEAASLGALGRKYDGNLWIGIYRGGSSFGFPATRSASHN